jgi:hypothetical protein
MTNFDASKVKPILYSSELLKLLRITNKPHFKCYIIKKYSRLSYNEKLKINKYFLKLKRNLGLSIYVYNNYALSQWQLSRYLKVCIVYNTEKIIETSINYNYKYTDEQIYMQILDLKDDILQIK